jgi:hypothetical protein
MSEKGSKINYLGESENIELKISKNKLIET